MRGRRSVVGCGRCGRRGHGMLIIIEAYSQWLPLPERAYVNPLWPCRTHIHSWLPRDSPLALSKGFSLFIFGWLAKCLAGHRRSGYGSQLWFLASWVWRCFNCLMARYLNSQWGTHGASVLTGIFKCDNCSVLLRIKQIFCKLYLRDMSHCRWGRW